VLISPPSPPDATKNIDSISIKFQVVFSLKNIQKKKIKPTSPSASTINQLPYLSLHVSTIVKASLFNASEWCATQEAGWYHNSWCTFHMKHNYKQYHNRTFPKYKRQRKAGMRQVAVGTKFCTTAPDICGSPIWNFPHITLLAPANSEVFWAQFVHLWCRKCRAYSTLQQTFSYFRYII
jgi:hypothetical protein